MNIQTNPASFQQMVKSGEVPRTTKLGGFVIAEVYARIKSDNKARFGLKINI